MHPAIKPAWNSRSRSPDSQGEAALLRRLIEQREQSLQDPGGRRRTAGNVEVDGNHLRDPSYHRIAAGKAATIPGTIPDGDDPFRIGGGMIGALQRIAHVLRYRSGYHQHIGMTRRRNEPETEALDVVVGIVQRMNFKFASIAGSGVDLAYGEAASETPSARRGRRLLPVRSPRHRPKTALSR